RHIGEYGDADASGEGPEAAGATDDQGVRGPGYSGSSAGWQRRRPDRRQLREEILKEGTSARPGSSSPAPRGRTREGQVAEAIRKRGNRPPLTGRGRSGNSAPPGAARRFSREDDEGQWPAEGRSTRPVLLISALTRLFFATPSSTR